MGALKAETETSTEGLIAEAFVAIQDDEATMGKTIRFLSRMHPAKSWGWGPRNAQEASDVDVATYLYLQYEGRGGLRSRARQPSYQVRFKTTPWIRKVVLTQESVT